MMFISSDDDNVPEMKNSPKSISLIQPKLSSYTPKLKKKHVSKHYYDQRLKEKHELETTLNNSVSLLSTLGPSLPDNGATLQKRISVLKIELQAKISYIDTLVIADNLPITKESPVEIAAKPKVLADWNALSDGLNAIQPKYTGAVGLSTFNTQKTLTMERLKQLHSSLNTCPAEDIRAKPPHGLKVDLMDHQLYALSWLNWRETQKPSGGILADDMGLGKTLSMISLVLENKENEDSSDDDENDSDTGSKSKNCKFIIRIHI